MTDDPQDLLTSRLHIGELASNPKVQAAYALALALHGNQKYDEKPYIEHVTGVTQLVYDMTMQHAPHLDNDLLVDELCAALLHDSVEDHPKQISFDNIRDRFGDRVSAMVEFCTDDREKWDWWERKKDYLNKLAYSGTNPEWQDKKETLVSAATISCADKLFNMRSTNRKLELAIKFGNAEDKTVYKFWKKFSGHMQRPHYDACLVEAFKTLEHDVRGIADAERFGSIVKLLTKEVEDMQGMMTQMEQTRSEFPKHQPQTR